MAGYVGMTTNEVATRAQREAEYANTREYHRVEHQYHRGTARQRVRFLAACWGCAMSPDEECVDSPEYATYAIYHFDYDAESDAPVLASQKTSRAGTSHER